MGRDRHLVADRSGHYAIDATADEVRLRPTTDADRSRHLNVVGAGCFRGQLSLDDPDPTVAVQSQAAMRPFGAKDHSRRKA